MFNKLLRICLFACLLVSCQLTKNSFRYFKKNTLVITNYSIKEIDALIETAKNYHGVIYRNGGTDEKGMDCSGLLFRVYSDQNFMIPRPTYQQELFGLPVSIDNIQKGDWVFFKTNGSKTINHVGLITKIVNQKEVYFIHASTSKGVREDNLFAKYWFTSFEKVIRPYKNNSN